MAVLLLLPVEMGSCGRTSRRRQETIGERRAGINCGWNVVSLCDKAC